MRFPLPCSTMPIIGIGLILAASSPVLAQSEAPPDGREGPPARIDNIYDHKDHQPTEAELRAAGAASFSSVTRQQVEKEVKELLEQTDRLDKQADEQDRGYSGSSSPGPKGGR